MGKSDTTAFRAIGVVAVVAAVVLVFLPVGASSSDARHDCGTLIAGHEEPLRRAFCEEESAYRDRLLWISGATILVSYSLAAVAVRRS